MILASLVLAGCSESKGDKALREYEMMSHSPMTRQERCAISKKIEQGYLEDENREKYRDWQTRALINCTRADLGY